MLDWTKRRVSMAQSQTDAVVAPAKRRGPVMSDQYLSLYKYLVERYADTVVLTFAQIEDLLGFKLPDSARLHQDWWTSADREQSSHVDAWKLASRTATPNLLARTVTFDRTS
jgi:hypothetical protein